MLETPEIVDTEPRHTAVIRFTIPRAEIQTVMGPAMSDVLAAVTSRGVTPEGAMFSHHLRFDPEVFDFEIGVPVPEPFVATGRVEPGSLPGGRAIRAVYQGPYDGLGAAWGEFDAWVKTQGHRTAADLWEVYTEGPQSTSDPERYRTELYRPLVD